MFRPTSRQASMFPVDPYLGAAARRRLEASWAAPFAEQVLPSLLGVEEKLASLYDATTGRPNWSVARMLGILILAAMFDLADGEALERLQFDLRWQLALGLDRNDAYLSRRSLVAFRARLANPDTKVEREVFHRVTEDALAKLGLSVKQVRLDSTHILSDIRVRSRVALFVDVLDRFLRELSKADPGGFESLPEAIRKWHSADGWSEEARGAGRLEELAGWMLHLHEKFAADPRISTFESYALLGRLLAEHCRVTDLPPTEPSTGASAPDQETPPTGGASPASPASPASDASPASSASPASDASPVDACPPTDAPSTCPPSVPTEPSEASPVPLRVEVLSSGAEGGRSLTSAADPDVQFGHKGAGYEAQIAETCGDGPARLIVDYDVTNSPEGDAGQAAATVARLAERGLTPERLLVDAGYTAPTAFQAVAALGSILEGPVRMERIRADQVGRDQFTYDPTTGQIVSCPEGHPVVGYGKYQAKAGGPITPTAKFEARNCASCARKDRCVALLSSKGGRYATVRDTPGLRLRDDALARRKEPERQKRQRLRTGCESTNSELKRAHGMRRLRVRRRRRVEIAVALAVTACNVKRWIRAASPKPPSRPRPRPYQPRKAGA